VQLLEQAEEFKSPTSFGRVFQRTSARM